MQLMGCQLSTCRQLGHENGHKLARTDCIRQIRALTTVKLVNATETQSRRRRLTAVLCLRVCVLLLRRGRQLKMQKLSMTDQLPEHRRQYTLQLLECN